VVGPNLKVSGTRFSPLHDLAVKTLPRSHDVDVHASDLVGIDGITRVLIVHILRTNNTTGNLLCMIPASNGYGNMGIYKRLCLDCCKSYTG
jgi:hypothetical protein